MQIKFFIAYLVVALALSTKATKKRRFEDNYERQLLNFNMGYEGFNSNDTDDSGILKSHYRERVTKSEFSAAAAQHIQNEVQ